jgi:hypothetical protein
MNDAFAPGTRVQVRNRFDGGWSPSPFEIAEAIDHTPTAPTYRLRRLSDGVVLPTDFISEDVRSADT